MEMVLRILLAAVLATCSPAWCACVMAQPAGHESPLECAVEANGCDDGLQCADEVRATILNSACCDHDSAPGEQPALPGDDCDCSCCANVVEFSAARGAIHAVALDALSPPPLPPALAQVETDDAHVRGRGSGGPGNERENHAGSPGSGSLLARSCLLLI